MIEKYFLKNELQIKRWRRFKKRKFAYYSLWGTIFLLFISLTAEFWANDKPIVFSHKGHIYFPIVKNYNAQDLGLTGSFFGD